MNQKQFHCFSIVIIIFIISVLTIQCSKDNSQAILEQQLTKIVGDSSSLLPTYLSSFKPNMTCADIKTLYPSLPDCDSEKKSNRFDIPIKDHPLVQNLACSCMTLNEFLKQPLDTVYDWIIAGNVFYHADINDLEWLAQKLSDRGFLMVMMGGPDYPLEVHDELKKISFGDSSSVHQYLQSSTCYQDYHITIDRVQTIVNLKDLYSLILGLTDRGKKLVSMLYQIPYQKFSEKQKKILNDLLFEAFKNNNRQIKHYHELFWFSRKS